MMKECNNEKKLKPPITSTATKTILSNNEKKLKPNKIR